jgi:uncharacterized C2H2 Zn-finger protein
MDKVTTIENAVGTKVQTGNSGQAFVEYAMDIKFKVDETIHAVKFTAYATTCKIMIQPLGEKSKTMESLDQKSLSRYFADTFFFPWCEVAYTNKLYDEKELMDALRNELARLDLLKVDARKGNVARGRLSSLPPPNVKCVAKTCKYTGLNSNNKLAVGVCSKCRYYEHFECSKTKPEDRELILRGEHKYFCSICFSKNPTLVAFEGIKSAASTTRSIQLTSSTTATPIAIEASVTFKCEVCKYETKDQEAYNIHTKESHSFVCETCKENLTSKADLVKHIENHHTRPCITCDLKFKTISELKAHMKTSHGPECTRCSKSFEKQEDLEKHIGEIHSTKANPKHSCTDCKETFQSPEDLSNHIQEKHTPTDQVISCPLCPHKCKDNEEFAMHLKANHALAHACSICERDFESKAELTNHIDKEHSSDCSICGNQFKTSTDLKAHLENCKIHNCKECDDIFYVEIDLEEHMLKNHNNKCTIGQEVFVTEAKLTEHVQSTHIFSCIKCDKVEETKDKLEKHIQENHSTEGADTDAFKCDYCDFEGNSVEIMMEHMIQNHTKKDTDNKCHSDVCTFTCNERENLMNHFKKEHKKKPLETDHNPGSGEEKMDSHEDYRQLKNNFERWNTLFQESLEEVSRVKSEYEAN